MNSIEKFLKDKIQPIGEQFLPATESEVAQAEREIGTRFPELFRQLQLSYGRLVFTGETLIHAAPGIEPQTVFTIFGCKGDVGNLVTDLKLHPDLRQKGLIPFADDMFNNRYVFSSQMGDISFVDYTQGKLQSMAKSFEDFLAKLQVIPD